MSNSVKKTRREKTMSENKNTGQKNNNKRKIPLKDTKFQREALDKVKSD